MLAIDKYAYTNRLNKVNSVEKISFSLITLLLCLVFNSNNLNVFVIITMSIAILYIAQIPVFTYLKALAIPVPFLIISVITIVININPDPESLLYGFRVKSLVIGITKAGISRAMSLFLRSLACISSMYFLAFTTSIVDITSTLRKTRIPMIFIEMMTIIYRFIFVLIDTAVYMKLSQECRLGYSNIKRSYSSLGALITNLFMKAYDRYRMLYLSLMARGYTGELNVVCRESKISNRNLALIGIYIVLIVLIGMK